MATVSPVFGTPWDLLGTPSLPCSDSSPPSRLSFFTHPDSAGFALQGNSWDSFRHIQQPPA